MAISTRGVSIFLFSLFFLAAQEPPPSPSEFPAAGEAGAAGRSPTGASSQEPQAYDKVITKDAKSRTGVFTVHEIKDKYYYEIPKTELDKEFLFVTQVARTTLGVGYGGQFVSERVVRWERHANKINLRELNYEVVADPKTPISLAVKAANNDTIVMSLPIAAFGKEKDAHEKDGKAKPAEAAENGEPEAKDEEAAAKDRKDAKAGEASATPDKDAAKNKESTSKVAAEKTTKDSGAKEPAKQTGAKEAAPRPASRPYKETGREPSIVIEVTRLFTSDVFELSARQRLNASSMDAGRSYIERVSPYPENIEVEATHTYTRMAPTPGSPAPANPFAAAGMRPGSATVVLHHSMVKLPEHPMTPRLFDERVGYFSVRKMDYGRDEQRAPKRIYITRWRLEKKDPTAALSEPVKPIVYYIDAATPSKWVPYMRRGVESWQKAFEAAGFKNAIIAKPAPTATEDPNFSPEDVRYSVIRWLPSTIENAVGPHISDPRTGEILNADIQFYHNVMNLQRDWYFLQVGPLDPRAARLPLPDDLMGRLVEFVCAHEVGHTLGFQHNMKASSLYPQEKVRDKDWVKKMGHTPSIMDYSRFNYVAQPEDGIDVADLVPTVGPYDVWATHWGYQIIDGAKTADDEKSTLDGWAREQDRTPWYRFSTPGAAGSDPGDLTEAVGDADSLKSTALGVKNLQRVARMMLAATTIETGTPYEDLAELYGRMLGQWTLEMNHVAALVGGFESQQKNIGQAGVIYTPVSKQRQAAAVAFLNDNAFVTPQWAIDKEILRRIEPLGAISRVGNAQRSVLNSLLNSARFARLIEQEALDGPEAYPAAGFVAAVRRGVWRELESPQVAIDAYRRQLQHNYLDLVNSKLNGPAVTLPVNLPSGFPTALFATSADEKPLYRAELRALTSSIGAALAKATDRTTRAHLEGARDQIAKILDPKFAAPSGSGSSELRIFADQWPDFWSAQWTNPPSADLWGDPSAPGQFLNAPWQQIQDCWPDYEIRP
ncbi:MAG: zinc-dependent metalloprotease [Bryobacteraceae bacterium]